MAKLGEKQSQETKNKIRIANLGKKLSASARRKISLSQLGRKQSQDTIDKRIKSRSWYKHTEETKNKIGKGNIGKTITEETRDKLRLSHLGHKLSEETKNKLSLSKKGENAWNYGKHPSEETLKRMSESRKGKKLSEEAKLNIKLARANPEYRAKLSQHMKDMWANMDVEVKNNRLEKHRLAVSTPEHKLKRTNISLGLWKKPEYKNKIVKEIMKGWHMRPNKPETFIASLLDKMYPGEYDYTGDGSFVVGGKCPDFCNETKKKLILFHGIYWHLIKFQSVNPNLTKEQVEQKDIAHYEKHGYDTLIIWEDEMVDVNKVLSRISQFNMVVVSDS